MVGLLLASVGGGALAFDLFNTWYTFRVPREVLSRVNEVSQQFGAFGGLVRAGAAFASHTTFKVSAWNALDSLHVPLLLLSGWVLAVALMAYSNRLQGGGGIITALGAIASVLILYRIVAPPGPSFDGQVMLHPTSGAWVGLAAAAAIVAGGVLESRSVRSARPASPPSVASWTAPAGPAVPGAVGGAPVGFAPPAGVVPQGAAGGSAPAVPAPAVTAPAVESTGWTPPEFFS
jgi:hypothetical protein